ncbi:RDD family protein [uncultured Ferrovibrio sp.]|jgi:Predicted membrane protein/domain|uniref:RDD family protein n=1 Tax=uncultured Ferrovibrio sp. TaxID=1576913 RepID=UPI00262D3974|nr:RDD family protein [uncultured Ferrovibrio sp.]
MSNNASDLPVSRSAAPIYVDPFADPAAFDGVIVRRIFAYLVDLIALVGVIFLYKIAVGLLTIVTFGLLTPILVLVGAAIPLAYHTLTIGGSASATPGMRLFDLQVSTWNGGKPGYLQALLQTAAFYVTVGLTSGLILIWALFNNRRRCLHDLLCGTVVHRRRKVA